MMVYAAFGVLIGSEIPLPELPPGAGEPDVVIRLGSVPYTDRISTPHEQFLFNGLAGAFRVSGGREIVVEPLPGVDAEELRVVLLGRVMASLVRQRGWLPLHASGVAMQGNAALLMGPSGAGKSTMAAALHARGHMVLTDDVAPVRVAAGICELLPTWSRLRLSAESLPALEPEGGWPLGKPPLRKVFQVDKYSVDLGQPALPKQLPLSRVYILDFGECVKLEILAPLAAAASLSLHSFVKRHRCDVESLRAHVGACAAVAETVPVFQLQRPQAIGSLPDLARFIERDMEAAMDAGLPGDLEYGNGAA